MAQVKIVIVGGGSFLWSKTIIRDIVVTKDLSGSSIVLHDIDSKSLNLILNLGQKIIKDAEANFKIDATTSRLKALEGADYVILTISTGGLESMRHDIEIPLKYGIYQSVGDTTGPGGISRALRNIPVVVEIGKDMERLCPDAWLINYSNPMALLCRALNRATKIKTIGLCHEIFVTLDMIREIFKTKKESDIQIKVAGINHFIWILGLKVKGKDGYPFLREYIQRYRIPKKYKLLSKMQDRKIIKFGLFKVFGYLPAAGDRHLAEFFPYFLTKESELGRKYGVELTTIEDRYRWRTDGEKKIKEILNGIVPIEMKRSYEAVSRVISSLANKRDEVHLVNLPNKGLITNLPGDVVIETFGVIGAKGVNGIPVGDLPENILGIIYPHVIKQELTVEAALKGDRQLALQSLLLDPLIKNFEDAKKILDEMLEANDRYLPQF